MHRLQIDNISKKYGAFKALDNVSLTLSNGIFGLLGPNGAGKSTLMRILTTLQPFDTGSIKYGEISWKEMHKVQKIIGYLPQHFSLYKHLSVFECLKHISILKGVRKAELQEQVYNALEQVNLLQIKDQKIGKLSGGMLRRVGIAQAIIGNPQIIVVDEPTAGLDPEERIRFRNILHTIGRNNIIIISSHIVEDIETLCNEVAILHKGKILGKGTINSLKMNAENVIWSTKVEKNELFALQNEVKIISQQSKGDYYEVRYLGNTQRNPHDQLQEPTLEDAYFYFMQKVDNSQC
ncbi:ATP-binding cassette domain-containing protein [Paenibacillus oenotherae]|uniref:ATP-binding cassette domain-containing protein n=1 Tax=Paenibacillus oenotherae TaxID=1435645 RepID=A0ABS7D7W7_9BACL|nr:ATP-binding cassette domain-containing protein [Paenibacillus oenotherae]MBW7476032.1 ATP-binding cassette domain-containing protein [Paenibacillus oenotherae]